MNHLFLAALDLRSVAQKFEVLAGEGLSCEGEQTADIESGGAKIDHPEERPRRFRPNRAQAQNPGWNVAQKIGEAKDDKPSKLVMDRPLGVDQDEFVVVSVTAE